MTERGLSNRYAEVIAFERAGAWTYPAIKESIVRERFDYSISRYYQVLNHALTLPAALTFDPRTVRRLLELRDARRQLSGRRRGWDS